MSDAKDALIRRTRKKITVGALNTALIGCTQKEIPLSDAKDALIGRTQV
ncbi:hypothetical protein [Alkalibacterium subtropicum]|nr:hypothetical protein [Alkalibacterium subtropicum]